MNKKIAAALLFIYFLSRVYFINAGGVFFDSPEYLQIFSLPNFISALADGHYPLHLGYIALFWPFFHFAILFHANPGYTVILAQIIVSTIALYCFYETLAYLSDKKTAFLSTIIFSLLPLYWVITDTIMMENAYIDFFLFSLYFLVRYIKENKLHNYLISLCFLCFAVMTHSLVSFWLPFIWYLVFYKQRNFFIKNLIFTSIAVFLGYFFNILFTIYLSHTTLSVLIPSIYRLKDDLAILTFSLKSALVILRDFIIIQMRCYTSLVFLLSIPALILCFCKDKKLFLLCILWIAPAIYINLWWDSLLPGRYASLSGLGFAFLAAYLVRNNKIASYTLIIYLLIVSIPAVNLLKEPVPYLEEANFAKSLPKDSLLIESHFSRPQVQQTYKGKLAAVNEPQWSIYRVQDEINYYLSKKKPIFISSAALSDPYGLYTGPYLHFLSLSYASPPEIQPIIEHYTVIKYKTIDASSNLIMYQVISHKKSPYPKVASLNDSYRRIDYTDPFWQIMWWTENAFKNKN